MLAVTICDHNKIKKITFSTGLEELKFCASVYKLNIRYKTHAPGSRANKILSGCRGLQQEGACL